MKILGVQFGNKEIDDVMSMFIAAEANLREIATRKKEEAEVARTEAERQTQLANLRAGEVGQALGIAGRLKLMINGDMTIAARA